MAKRTYYMKVSIIIPIYKVEPYIERCIQSVLRQTYRDLEVILVDDCTPDRSMEMAKACIEQSPLSKDLQIVYLRHEQNRGVSVCRNDGIDAATGEYLMFIDSDDYITDDCIETLVKPLENFSYDMVIGNYELRQNGFDVRTVPLAIQGAITGVHRIAASYLKDNIYSMPWNKLCKTSYIKDNKLYFQERLPSEDELWTALTACTANSMYAEQHKTYHYALREGSFITTNTQEMLLPRCMRILQCFYEECSQRKLDAKATEIVEKRLSDIVSWAGKGLSPFKIYKCLRQCDTRSWNTKLKTHRSVKNIVLHIDQYLPVKVCYAYKYSYATIGSVCQKTIYGLKLMKHKLHTVFS